MEKGRALGRVEWPTVALGLGIYGAWMLLTWAHHRLPAPLVLLLGGALLAWHGSLQHEAVHGHPTSSRALNALFAGVPLGLWLPFSIYRRSHLAHHGVRRLTDPDEDPESFYVTAAAWARATPLSRAWLRAESTLLGRLVLGPFRVVARTLAEELARARRRPGAALRVWGVHALAVAPVLAWLSLACDIDPGSYLLLYVYPGLSLTLLRSFAEHRAGPDGRGRSAIVEAEAPLAWLFLHNNLHAVHHARPGLPWYRLPACYRARRDALREDEGCFFYAGYREILWRHLWRSKGSPVHPGVEP